MNDTQHLATSVVRGACPHDCPDSCAWQVTVRDGIAVKLAGDPDHPYTRGGLCAKVNHYLERAYSPDRILFPLRRIGPKGAGRFERVSWDEALDDITARLQTIIETNGPTAVLPYSYMGTQGLIQRSAVSEPFFGKLGATRLERAVCGSTGSKGVSATLGTPVGMLPEEVTHSRFIILWGTNTIVTNLHLWPFIRQAQANGATVVVIDPLKTRTAAGADWHVRPMPGSDAALALGMMHVIVAEGLYDADYVAQNTVGFDQLCERLADYPPERAAALTGLEADEIIRLARAYASTPPAMIRLLIGMEHRSHGAMTFRTIACLPGLVGAWRKRGGGLLFLTASLFFEAFNMNAVCPNWEDATIRSVNMVQLGQALTDPTLTPPIQALIVYNSNPAVIAPNQQLVLQGLRREDLFTVVHEQFLTDTARHADYVLPATTQLEHWDLLWSWGQTYLSLNRPAIAPRGEALPNTEFFRRLAAHMGLNEPYFGTSDEDLVRATLASDHPSLSGISFERLLQEGWAPLTFPEEWRPLADGRFPTASGKCEFYSARLGARGIDPLPSYIPARESLMGDLQLSARYPLSLITAKSALHFLNSSYANLPRHLKAEREPVLEMHPNDATYRGIVDRDLVRIYNDRGTVEAHVCLSDRVRPGVVSLPSGWWASLSPGGSSANTLTADGLSDWGGGGDFHDTLVEVAASPSALPASTSGL